ncbi:DUF616 domain-containing protein [Gammaproteobacteria bacterium]|nr:DUF616 domain-containing protein [Gammaproteobacteria bacterium]
MKDQRLVVYTCVTGGFDSIEDIPSDFPFECIVFTDDSNLTAHGWRIVVLENQEISKIELNRKLKILSSQLLSEYRYTLYIDGNVKIEPAASEFIEALLSSPSIISLNRHPRFTSVYDDLFEIFRAGIAPGYKVKKVFSDCLRAGISLSDNFYECNIIFRKNCHSVTLLNNLWWYFYKVGSGRDQGAFRLATFVANIEPTDLQLGDIRSSSGSVFSVLHHKLKKQLWRRLFRRFVSEMMMTRLWMYLYYRRLK